MIGWFALLLALGKRPPETDQRGAMQEVVRHRGGYLLLFIIAVGLAGYAVFRLSEAAFGVVGEGKKTGPRLQSLVRGLVYGFLAVNAFALLLHAHTQSQAGQQELLTAKAMRHNGGRWVVGLFGVIVIVVGIVLVIDGVTGKFKKYFAPEQMSAGTQQLVWTLGTVGSIARGVVFALTGFFLARAAYQYDPSKARGLDGALRSVADTPTGRLLVGLAGLGLIAFGLYGYAEARWRRV